ncbi:MAG: hypothetical protein P4L33_06625 [Capsulimonadaceae bacterium]|nr:hypothetical protein [Capsulimonadaceae bacterium]
MTNEELALFRSALDDLANGDLSGAHSAVQRLEGIPIADAVHAIIHRRDGDYGNSAYWWSSVGSALPADLLDLYDGDPLTFVDLCRRALPGSPDAARISNVERLEVEVLRGMLPARSSEGA